MSGSSVLSSKSGPLRPPAEVWVTYERCFLFTLGGLLIGFAGIVWGMEPRSSLVIWGNGMLLGFLALGALLITAGIVSDTKKAAWWADVSSPDEASVVVMALGAPLYFVLKHLLRLLGRAGSST